MCFNFSQFQAFMHFFQFYLPIFLYVLTPEWDARPVPVNELLEGVAEIKV